MGEDDGGTAGAATIRSGVFCSATRNPLYDFRRDFRKIMKRPPDFVLIIMLQWCILPVLSFLIFEGLTRSWDTKTLTAITLVCNLVIPQFRTMDRRVHASGFSPGHMVPPDS
jgi:hypothetical protein